MKARSVCDELTHLKKTATNMRSDIDPGDCAEATRKVEARSKDSATRLAPWEKLTGYCWKTRTTKLSEVSLSEDDDMLASILCLGCHVRYGAVLCSSPKKP